MKIILLIILSIITINASYATSFNNCLNRTGCDIYNSCTYTKDLLRYNFQTFQYEMATNTYTIEWDISKYNTCLLDNLNLDFINQQTVSNNECSKARNELSELYIQSTKYLNNIIKRDTLSYNLRELKKLTTKYKTNLDIANGIFSCLIWYTYQEWYNYQKWIYSEYSNKYKEAIYFYKEALNYTKKELWDNINNNATYKDLVNRINYLSKNYNLVWLCWLNSLPTSDWKCSCNTWYTWVDYNDSKNMDCKKKVIVKENISTTCWVNEYYYTPTEDDYFYDLWSYCTCNQWYDKVPWTTLCTLASTYIPTLKDKALANKFKKIISKLALNNFSKLEELEKKIIKLFPKINKNSRVYYLLNWLYSNISFETLMNWLE